MGLLGGIGLMAAIANYNSAKKAYDAAVEKEQGLVDAVKMAIANRDQAYEDVTDGTVNPNKPLDGVKASTILRIGNLANARAFQRAQAAVVLVNETENTYLIKSAEARCRINGIALTMATTQKRNLNAYLYPGKKLEIPLPGSKIILPNPPKDDLKTAICQACKRSLITSCWEINLNGIETADIAIEYTGKSGAGTAKRARYVDVDGVVRYMKENYYPNEA